MSDSSDLETDLADDLLDGAEAIGKFMGPGWNRRRVYYAANCGLLPIFRFGNRLSARKSTLRQRVEELERDATE